MGGGRLYTLLVFEGESHCLKTFIIMGVEGSDRTYVGV